ncbi:hypothetical protein KUTeg_004134 [Tegillarca granosa]|uniref:SAP domain-containing protein n=1 Tax=Tegillarca granosa TaxID=220873 RepID=A0ABQ9FP68_TEGGR|nr:hypothetical protein KUTeg_004134 [Tegillarca granosa]
MKSRYTNLYIPSDFFNANFSWTEAFPLVRPFQLGHHCNFHVLHKDVESVSPSPAVLDPPDADHLYSAKETFVHPTRLIHFLVGQKGKNETMAIGGPWSPSLDGVNPEEDPKVLIKTAIRTTQALTGIDLSACTQWYRFAEVRYLRPEEMHKGRLVQARVETTVIFLPDVWSCTPTRIEWGTMQTSYKKQLQKKLAAVSKDENSQALKSTLIYFLLGYRSFLVEEDEGGEIQGKLDPTHFSELDPKVMKIIDLRKELESRTLSSKGLKSQLIARLTKAMKTEQEKEEAQEAMEVTEQAAQSEEVKKNLEVEEKSEDKKKEEEEKKKKEEREKASLERKYVLPDNPAILVHPNSVAKSGKFDCTVTSLSVLLDYRPEDNKEHSFEVSLFAELFNEMLMRDYGFEIYKSLVKAPEKKEEEKKDKDKDKKTEDKNSKKEKDDEKKNEGEKKEEIKEEEEEAEDDDEKAKKDKDKKKEKKKYTTVEPALLMAFTYFDQNHTGYMLDKDVEEIIHTIGLQLSRAQVRKLVQKVVSRDAVSYRKLTDKPLPGQGDTKEEPVKEVKEFDIETLAQDLLKKTSESKEESCQKMTAEIKQLKQKLLVQEKVTNNSESTSKKYLSALMESKEHLTAMLASVTEALGDKGDNDEVEIKKETDIKSNGAS